MPSLEEHAAKLKGLFLTIYQSKDEIDHHKQTLARFFKEKTRSVSDAEFFAQKTINRLYFLCAELQTSPGVDRCLDVVVHVAVDLATTTTIVHLLDALVEFVNEASTVTSPGPRLRACQLAGLIVKYYCQIELDEFEDRNEDKNEAIFASTNNAQDNNNYKNISNNNNKSILSKNGSNSAGSSAGKVIDEFCQEDKENRNNEKGVKSESDAARRDRIIQNMERLLLERVKDKVTKIRVEAIRALGHLLYDEKDANNPELDDYPPNKAVVNALRDLSTEVRCAALLVFQIHNRQDALLVLARAMNDGADRVRKVAYGILAGSVGPSTFPSVQRLRMLRSGLNDISKDVKWCVKAQLLPKWFELQKGNLLRFFVCFDPYRDAETVQAAAKALFSEVYQPPHDTLEQFVLKMIAGAKQVKQVETPAGRSTNKEKENKQNDSSNNDVNNQPGSQNRLTLGSNRRVVKAFSLDERTLLLNENFHENEAFLWRCLSEFCVQKAENDGELARALCHLLPTMKTLCDFVKNYAKSIERADECEARDRKEWALMQLLKLIDSCDDTDPVGRNAWKQLLEDLLGDDILIDNKDTIDFVISQLISKFYSAPTEIEEVIVLICDRISALRSFNKTDEDMEKPAKHDNQVGGFEVEADEHDDSEASLFGDNVELKKDPKTLIRCLTLFNALLRSPHVLKITAYIREQYEHLVHEVGFNNESPSVRILGIESLALCSLKDGEIASDNLPVLRQALQVDIVAVKRLCLRAITDLGLVYGFGVIARCYAETEGDDDEDPVSALLTVYLDHLHGLDESISEVAGESLCKLFLHDRIGSYFVLSRLILDWFNPVSRQNGPLNLCLSNFLDIYATSSRSHQELIVASFLPLMEMLQNAPYESPLKQVDPANVAKFLVAQTRYDLLHERAPGKKSGTVQGELAIKLLNCLIRSPEDDYLRIYGKSLSQLIIENIDDRNLLTDLTKLTNEALQHVTQKSVVQILEKFGLAVDIRLEALKNQPGALLEEDEEEGGSDSSTLKKTNASNINRFYLDQSILSNIDNLKIDNQKIVDNRLSGEKGCARPIRKRTISESTQKSLNIVNGVSVGRKRNSQSFNETPSQ